MSQQTRRGRCTGVRTGPQRWGAARQGRGPFGHLDLAGNVWQWCRDGFKSDEYRSRGRRRASTRLGSRGTTSGCCAVALGGLMRCGRPPGASGTGPTAASLSSAFGGF
ncbi:MAG: SUMF1/EgtB/PvdO family nonheme iron enzyme [Nannocystis sp.]|nr:SUMF1/EgtB/PvdO family nonheme iron enzyme [Nannocystis sp.]